MRTVWVSAALALVVSGCSTFAVATKDSTRLRGEVPTGLGRILEVRAEGGDAWTRRALQDAVRREFVSRDLFDRVKVVDPGSLVHNPAASTLWVTVLESELTPELIDLFEMDQANTCRYELEIDLRDQADRDVIYGHVTGVSFDTVTEGHLQGDRPVDLRIAALHDAAMKMSRALRHAATSRGAKALDRLPRVRLASGVGPVPVVTLGLDDPTGERLGDDLSDLVQLALRRLGPEVDPVPRSEIEEGLRRLKSPIDSYWDVAAFELEEVRREVGRGDVYVIGRVRVASDRIVATVRILETDGTELAREEVSAVGLGALRVVAAKIARLVATSLPDLS